MLAVTGISMIPCLPRGGAMQSIVVHTGRSRNGHIGAIHTCMQGLYYCYGRNCYNCYRAPRAPWQWGGRSGRGPHYTTLVYGRARLWARPYYYAISTRIWNQDERRGARGTHTGSLFRGDTRGHLERAAGQGVPTGCISLTYPHQLILPHNPIT